MTAGPDVTARTFVGSMPFAAKMPAYVYGRMKRRKTMIRYNNNVAVGTPLRIYSHRFDDALHGAVCCLISNLHVPLIPRDLCQVLPSSDGGWVQWVRGLAGVNQ
mgnify:CR=1 FL=1